MSLQKFSAAVFSLSFKKFATPQFASQIFIVALIGNAIMCIPLFFLPLGFITAPCCFILGTLAIRIALEVVLAIFQIARYSAEVARRGRPAGESSADIEN